MWVFRRCGEFFCKFFSVLDEPTNDFDVTTLRFFAVYLVDFAGCVIVLCMVGTWLGL